MRKENIGRCGNMPNWTNNRLEFNSFEDAKKVFDGMQFTSTYYNTDMYGNAIGEGVTKTQF